MKSVIKLLSLLFVILVLTNTAHAESPREQLKQMIGLLQTNPNDNALREKIIKLAQQLKPAPALPDEAERRMQRGAAALEGAKSVAGYRDAAKEFEQATLAAPWYGDAYFNLGVAQDKAENYEAALRSLKLALLASPDDKEIKALIFKVEYRNEKANSPEARAMKQKADEESFLRSMDGARFRVVLNFGSNDALERIFEVHGKTMVETNRLLAISKGATLDGMSTPGQTREASRLTWRDGAFFYSDNSGALVISPDGGKLAIYHYDNRTGAVIKVEENYAVRQ